MKLDFNGKHVVVTGGSGSLGSAVLTRLLDSGAVVSVPVHGETTPDDEPFAGDNRVFTRTGIDLADESEARRFYSDAVEYHGSLWGSVHAAGGFAMGKIGDTNLEAFERQMRKNLFSCYNCCRAAIHWMRKSESNAGRIVNTAARPALEPRQGSGMTAYTASKAGVSALTQSLAAEVADEEILVNAVAPSIIDTPANREAMPGADFGQWPKPGEIASQIEYLVSPENKVTRGAVVPVYGES